MKRRALPEPEPPPDRTSARLSMRRRRRLSRLLVTGALVALILAALSGDLAGWTGLHQPAAVTLVILLVAATLWITEAIPLFATSLLILFLELTWLQHAFRIHGKAQPDQRFLAPFFSNVVLLFLGGFVLSAALRKFMVDERVARWVLQRSGGRPAALLGSMMAVTAVLSMWMSNTAAAAMMLGLSVRVLEQVPRADPLRKAVVLGIAFSANLGGLGTPIGTPPNAIVLDALKTLGPAPGFATWLLLALPILLVLLAGTWWLLQVMFPTETTRLAPLSGQSAPWTPRSIGVVVIGAITAMAWLLDGVHPLATGTVALIPVVTFFGFGLLSPDDFRGLPWDVLVLAGGGLSLGVAVESSGLGVAVVKLLPTEAVDRFVLAGALAITAGLLTSLMSNTATANLLVPVVVGIPGESVEALLLVVAFSCSTAMALPVSTPPNAMAFASGAVQTRDMVKAGLLISAVALTLISTFGLLWWGLFGIG